LRLRGALLTTLTVWALTVIFAVRAAAGASTDPKLPAPTQESSQESPPAQSSSSATESQPQSSPALGAIAAYQGLIVAGVDFPGVSEVDLERLRKLIPQKPGETLDRDRVRESILALHATGRFADVQVEAARTPEGQLTLVFRTTPNYFVGQIFVDGTPSRPTENQIANASKFQLGELFVPEKLDRALSNIKRMMEENGYYQSAVTYEEERHPETQLIDIRFHVRPGPQARVGRLNVTGTPGFSEGQVQDIAKMHPGDLVTVQLINRALDRLHKKYQKRNQLLAQVTVSERSYRSEANVVDYTFDITSGPKVNIITEGFRISRGVLKRSVPVYEENALDDDLLNEGRRNLLNYLQGRGHFDAKVDLKKSSTPGGGELRVVYDIDAGPRHKFVKLDIAGNMVGDKGFPEETLRARMQIQPAGRFFSHGRYSQALLNEDIRGLEDLYRANGFEQVKITSTSQDDYQGRPKALAITLKVDMGPQTLVGALQISGNQIIAQDQFPPLNTVAGQPFSEFNVASDRDILLNYYFNSGFPDATLAASAAPASGGANRMDVTFTLHEGMRVFVDRVLVSGLDHTRPAIVQRDIQVKSGDPLSQIDLLKTQQKLYDLGIFSQVDTAVQNPDGNELEKDVLVVVQEAKRYTFNYGFGFEFQTGQPSVGGTTPLGQTGVSPRLSFGVTRLNLRGLDHTITFKSNVGRLQQRGLISYDAPRWFNSVNWRLTLTGFYDNTVDVTTFTSQRLEGSVQAEEILSKNLASGKTTSLIDYRFTYRRVKAAHVEVSQNLIPLLSQPTRVGMPGLSYIRNRRDDDLEPTRGNYNTVDGGVADSHFGSEADFSRVLVQNSSYYSFGKRGQKFVFARSTRVGLENAFGNTSILPPGQACPVPGQTNCEPPTLIPLPERFLSGGGNSHRGFGLNQAGPRDPVTGFPLGGSALVLNNLELRMPPPTLPFFHENLSFAIFHDAGNVFVNGRNMLDNLLRWRQKNAQLCLQETTANQCDYSYISHAIGVGVRYRTPIGPVRFDFGYNLNPPAFPSCQMTPPEGNPAQSTYCLKNSNKTLPYFAPQHANHFNVFFSIGQTF
jgi:outer membrane protein insertion porin family